MARIGKTRIGATGACKRRQGRFGPTRRGLLSAGAVLATALLATRPGAAQTPQRAALTAQDTADLQRIAAYLNGIHTMYAHFRQYASNGATATGQLWMERPGRMRFEYDPPSPIVLIADRFYVYYIDKKLDETTQVGLKSTPAWLLLRDPISFDDVVVTRFERRPNLIEVTVVEAAKPDLGALTMVFRDPPLALVQWTILDAQRRLTTVTLSDERFGMALDPKLFIYNNANAPANRYH